MPSSVLLGYPKLPSAQEKEIYSIVNLRKKIIDTGRGIDIAIKYTDMEIQIYVQITYASLPFHQYN